MRHRFWWPVSECGMDDHASRDRPPGGLLWTLRGCSVASTEGLERATGLLTGPPLLNLYILFFLFLHTIK